MFNKLAKIEGQGKSTYTFSAERIPLFLLSTGVGMQRGRVGAIQGKVGRIQVLAGLAPPSQTVVCNIRALRKVAPSIFGRKNRREVAENI